MASLAEFKSMERELNALEREYVTFESSFRTATQTIEKTSFDTRRYSSGSIGRTTEQTAQQLRVRVEKRQNDGCETLRKHKEESLARIKESVRDYNALFSSLADGLKLFSDMNETFCGGRYLEALPLAIEAFKLPALTDDAKRYAAWIELECFDRLCRTKMETLVPGDYELFTAYLTLCKELHAKKHLPSALKYVFAASCRLLSDRETIPSDQAYSMALIALKCYDALPEEDRAIAAPSRLFLYETAKTLFNSFANEAYDHFDYPRMKELLAEAPLFDPEEIECGFFRDGTAAPEKVFAYIVDHFELATPENLSLAFVDTLPLAKNVGEPAYPVFWIDHYDRFGEIYCAAVFREALTVPGGLETLCTLIENRSGFMLHPGKLAKTFADAYSENLHANAEQIHLETFVNHAIRLNEFISNDGALIRSEDEHESFADAEKFIDGTSFSMITRYRRYCCSFDDERIKQLNVVLDDASVRLLGKRYLKNLRKNKKETDFSDLYVSLVTDSMRRKKRKFLFLIGIAASLCALGILAAVVWWLISK